MMASRLFDPVPAPKQQIIDNFPDRLKLESLRDKELMEKFYKMK